MSERERKALGYFRVTNSEVFLALTLRKHFTSTLDSHLILGYFYN